MIRNVGKDLKAIVFDAVGTLIEPSPTVAEVYAEAAWRQGAMLATDTIRARFRRHFGPQEGDNLEDALATDEPAEAARWRRIVSQCLPEVPDLERAFRELWDHFGRPEAWAVFPDVAPALRDLEDAGLRLGIGSNFDGRLRQAVAGLDAIGPCVDTLVISSEVGFRKPHPAFYGAACQALGATPEQVLWVGDDPDRDLHGPLRAGLRAILLNRQGAAPEGLPGVPDLATLAVELRRKEPGSKPGTVEGRRGVPIQ